MARSICSTRKCWLCAIALNPVSVSERQVFFIIAGLVTLEIIIEALILMPAIFLGTWMGARFFHTATPERFWAALHGPLICGGLVLVGKGFAKMR